MESENIAEHVVAHHAATPFNTWAGIELVHAGADEVVLRLPFRPDLGQAYGGLHAGVIMGMLENAAGFACGVHIGAGLVTHMSIDFMESAQGEGFLAVGRVVRAGRRQTFAESDCYVELNGGRGPRFASARATVVAISPR